jgi:hypothetical protein
MAAARCANGRPPSNSVRGAIVSTFARLAAIGIDNVVLSALPEPGSWALLLAGVDSLLTLARRCRAG